jgi:N-methylhydantoinase B
LALGHDAGWEKLETFSRSWFDYSEKLMAERIRKLPKGKATGSSTHDAIPGTPAEGIKIVASVESKPEEGRIAVDLRDNIDALPCGLNLTEACCRTAVLVAVFNSVGGSVPRNAGSFRRVEMKLRKNSVAGIPVHPTSCSVSTTNVADRVTHSVSLAIGQLGEGFGTAEFGGFLPPSDSVVSGVDPRTGERFVNQLFLGCTTGGATPFGDAWLTYTHVGNGGMCLFDSIELDELYQPIRVDERRLLKDSEGAGRNRGASSLQVEFGPIGCEIEVGYVSDGNVNAPHGVRGGMTGGNADQHRRKRDGSLEKLAACAQVKLQDGETIVSVCCGGGGYGSPRERSVEQVDQDVAEGWISPERARDVYGVVLDSSGRVDLSETNKLRATSR